MRGAHASERRLSGGVGIVTGVEVKTFDKADETRMFAGNGMAEVRRGPRTHRVAQI